MTATPLWMKRTLMAAALYNMVWGALVVLFPSAWFKLAGMEQPAYPQLWQCIGMIVGVYGVGYAIASTDPVRWWPIVLVGLLGKILGPIGFAGAAARDELPLSFGWMILTNDLIWWIPFGAVIVTAWQRYGSLKGALECRFQPRSPV